MSSAHVQHNHWQGEMRLLELSRVSPELGGGSLPEEKYPYEIEIHV